MAKLLTSVSWLSLIQKNLAIFCFLILRNRKLKMHVIFMVSSVLNLEEIMHCVLIITLCDLFAVEHIMQRVIIKLILLLLHLFISMRVPCKKYCSHYHEIWRSVCFRSINDNVQSSQVYFFSYLQKTLIHSVQNDLYYIYVCFQGFLFRLIWQKKFFEFMS